MMDQIFTEDVKKDQCLAYPELYRPLQLGRLINIRKFCIWTWKSIYQGFVIMFMTSVLFKDSFIELVTVTFSSLILLELLNVASTVLFQNGLKIIEIYHGSWRKTGQNMSRGDYHLGNRLNIRLFHFHYLLWLRDRHFLAHIGFLGESLHHLLLRLAAIRAFQCHLCSLLPFKPR